MSVRRKPNKITPKNHKKQIKILKITDANLIVNTTTEKLTGVLSVLVLTGVHFGLFAVAAFGYCLIYVIATWCGDVGRQLSGFLLFLFPLFPSHDFC